MMIKWDVYKPLSAPWMTIAISYRSFYLIKYRLTQHYYKEEKQNCLRVKSARQKVSHVWTLNIFGSILIKMIGEKKRRKLNLKERALEKWGGCRDTCWK